MKKLLTLLLSMVLFVAPLIGCGGGSGIDKNKTQLYIGVFEGGIGTDYLQTIIDQFEKDPVISNTSFESGKTGVQVIFYEDKDDYAVGALAANAKYMKEDIFILNDVSIDALIENNIAADITSLVTENVYSGSGEIVENGTNSISSNMKDYVKVAYNVGTEAQPKYYSIPYAASIMGIVYDADLFAQKDYYFNSNDEIISTTDYSNTALSLGSDGIESYDDGLPKTWEQFKDLMQVMRSDGVIPFTWAYNPVIYYRIAPLVSFWAQYEGANDFALNYSYSGVDSQFGEITEENAYQLYGQNGRLAALTVGKDIISDSRNYSTHAFYTSQTHTEAQREYISSIRGVNGQKRIAMLFEGGWWENESRAVFDEMGKTTAAYGYGKRNFKIMPLPSFIGTEGVPDQTYQGRTVNVSLTGSNICVNRKTTKTDLCKAFLQYLHSAESLRTFTKVTGVTKPFAYTMSQDDLNQMTPFARSCYEMLNDENVDLVTQLTTSGFRKYLGTKVQDKEWQTLLPAYGEFKEPLAAFYNNSGITAKAYFDGAIEYYEDMWAGQYENYLFVNK